jgi:hypothetical protein
MGRMDGYLVLKRLDGEQQGEVILVADSDVRLIKLR